MKLRCLLPVIGVPRRRRERLERLSKRIREFPLATYHLRYWDFFEGVPVPKSLGDFFRTEVQWHLSNVGKSQITLSTSSHIRCIFLQSRLFLPPVQVHLFTSASQKSPGHHQTNDAGDGGVPHVDAHNAPWRISTSPRPRPGYWAGLSSSTWISARRALGRAT